MHVKQILQQKKCLTNNTPTALKINTRLIDAIPRVNIGNRNFQNTGKHVKLYIKENIYYGVPKNHKKINVLFYVYMLLKKDKL